MHTEKAILRFSDFDIAGHVHNAVYLQFFEQGRIGFFFNQVAKKWDWDTVGLVVARNEIDYKSPIFFEHKPMVETYLKSKGKSSFVLGYRVFDEVSNVEFAVGSSVMVCYNYKSKCTVPIPNEWVKVFDSLLSE